MCEGTDVPRFRADEIRKIHDEAVNQGFTSQFGRGSGHVYLACPRCWLRVPLSTTQSAQGRNVSNVISQLRQHGFIWQGRPAIHTALQHARRKQPR